MVSIIWKVVTSRAGLSVLLFCVVLGGLYGWHVHDKAQAVAAARKGYVQAFELAKLKAQLEAVHHQKQVAEQANKELQEQVRSAEAEAQQYALELEAYEHETEINPDGVVDSDLLRRLRER